MGHQCSKLTPLCCDDEFCDSPNTLSHRNLSRGESQESNYFNDELLHFSFRAIEEINSAYIKQRTLKNPNILIHFSNLQCVQGGSYSGHVNKSFKREGFGIQYWKNGAAYSGYWKNNKAHNQGMLTHPNQDRYTGEWRNGKAHGYGIGIFRSVENEIEYAGEWENDKQHGYGVEIWKDKSKYTGEFEFGFKHGYGRYEWSDGGVYMGEWMKNQIEGYGLYHRRASDGLPRIVRGQWHECVKHGLGMHQWSNLKYEGEFEMDKKCGFGVYSWEDGKKHAGYWRNGLQHGTGITYGPRGLNSQTWYDSKNILKTGVWINGKKKKNSTEKHTLQKSEIEENQKEIIEVKITASHNIRPSANSNGKSPLKNDTNPPLTQPCVLPAKNSNFA